jgi:hypothetical protein
MGEKAVDVGGEDVSPAEEDGGVGNESAKHAIWGAASVSVLPNRSMRGASRRSWALSNLDNGSFLLRDTPDSSFDGDNDKLDSIPRLAKRQGK